MSGFFEFGRDNVLDVVSRYGKRNKRRRNIEGFKRAAHGVLAAYRAYSEVKLCFECAKESGERFTPSFGRVLRLFKVFLECEINILELCARCDEL